MESSSRTSGVRTCRRRCAASSAIRIRSSRAAAAVETFRLARRDDQPPARGGLPASCAAITKSSSAMRSSAEVLAAIHSGRSGCASMNCQSVANRPGGRGVKSYFRLPPRYCTLPGGAPQQLESRLHLVRLRQDRVAQLEHRRKTAPERPDSGGRRGRRCGR